MKIPFAISGTLVVWGLVGAGRFISEKWRHWPTPLPPDNLAILRRQVAICVPAHNEAISILRTLESLERLVTRDQIYVVSDGSTDETADVVRSAGYQLLELMPGLGKAGALESLIAHFHLFDRYRFILLADADTVFDEAYLGKALTMLVGDKRLAVVTAHGYSYSWGQGPLGWTTFLLVYRFRLWRLLQALMTYGQTSPWFNVYPVIPGYASLYRSSVLRRIQLAVPGIAIEDFNAGFQLHKKRLGKIGYHYSAWATSQDPDNFKDYWRQVYRWNIGFWQTIKHWKVWPSLFWVSLSVFILESIGVVFSTLVLPTILTLALLLSLPIGVGWDHPLGEVVELALWGYLVLYVTDYVITLIMAWLTRSINLVIYGPFFFILHYVNAIIFVMSIPAAFFTSSNGRWKSPKRLK